MLSFKLRDSFVESYKTLDPGFGFNGVGLFTYYRTYSRIKENGENEKWYETVRRVVEGIYSIQKDHILYNNLGWNDIKGLASAEEMYDRIFKMKFLPAGRMLWALGTELVHKRGIGQALFNCAFVSTNRLGESTAQAVKPFAFMMDMSMVGVGVGFDVKGHGKLLIQEPKGTTEYVIPDSREGWVESLKLLLKAYFKGSGQPVFDYSKIRPLGEPIKGFGGIASGPAPLIQMHERIKIVLDNRVGDFLTQEDIVDIMNMIGACVVAGNVRRTAQISLGSEDDEDYLKLKDYRWDGTKNVGSKVHRAEWGWASNNSIFARPHTNFNKLGGQTALNGEPGYVFMDNIRAYSRMCDPMDHKDAKADGTNPCAEQTLESYELCDVVDNFPSRAESKEDFLRTLKFSYLVGKTVTLVNTTWPETNRVQKRNRRIGNSVSGVATFLESHSVNELIDWLTEGYEEQRKWDKIYSAWLTIPESIKKTSVKPSGTVSLLAGVTPGAHFAEFDFYIRRIRVAKTSPMLEMVKKAGYHVEESVTDPNTMVVSFPVKVTGKTVKDASIWEKVSLASILQKYWADNQVSCTVTFDKDEAGQIPIVLEHYARSLKAISFLPTLEIGAYPQMPYEAITEEKYKEMLGNIKSLNDVDYTLINHEAEGEKFCGNDTCEISELIVK